MIDDDMVGLCSTINTIPRMHDGRWTVQDMAIDRDVA